LVLRKKHKVCVALSVLVFNDWHLAMHVIKGQTSTEAIQLSLRYTCYLYGYVYGNCVVQDWPLKKKIHTALLLKYKISIQVVDSRLGDDIQRVCFDLCLE